VRTSSRSGSWSTRRSDGGTRSRSCHRSRSA
jgi:hypothetical protein